MHHQLARLDLFGGGINRRFHFRRDQGGVVVVQRVAHAGRLEIKLVEARHQIGAFLEGVVNRHIDPLQHRGQHRPRMQVVLVGIDADRQNPLVRRRLQHADAGAARRGIDHVGTLRFLRFRQLAPLHRIVPRGRVRAGHVQNHLGRRVGRQHALGIAAAELADQGDVHAADEADGARFRGHARQQTDQIAAFMFGKHHRFHVGLIDHHVDDGKPGVGKIGGDLRQHVAKGKAGHHHRVGTRFGQPAQRLLALRFGLHFQFLEGAAGLGRPLRGTGKCGLVEGLVELAAEIIDDCGLGQRHPGAQRQHGGGTKQICLEGHGCLPVVPDRCPGGRPFDRTRDRADRAQSRANTGRAVNSYLHPTLPALIL